MCAVQQAGQHVIADRFVLCMPLHMLRMLDHSMIGVTLIADDISQCAYVL